MTIKLKSAHIENFRSLGDVNLNFKDLTILVGANASGKSNCLDALDFLRLRTQISQIFLIGEIVKIGSQHISIETFFYKDGDNEEQANYKLSVSITPEKYIHEILCVNGVKVIDVKDGKGTVKDENSENIQIYNSKKGDLALKSASYFGNKPFTSELAKFIEDWKVYDIDPRSIRKNIWDKRLSFPEIKKNDIDIIPKLDLDGTKLEDIFCYWYENDSDKFKVINQELEECLNINLELETDSEGEKTINVKETDNTKVPLSSMSDGTLRLLGYYVLLYQDEIPPLIGIEEPERNFHPGILRDIAAILKKLSKRTQIIITTHSSQLLDCFTYDEIMSDVAVILLSKKDDSGTQAIALDELSKKREDLTEWMQDFGVGSAVYDSHLLDEILNKQNA